MVINSSYLERHMGNIEQNFEDLGVDAITGVNLMRLTGITPDDFLDPISFMKFQDVIKYFKNVPNTEYIINKITIGKPVDKLNHIWGFVQMEQQKQHLLKLNEELKKETEHINQFEPENEIAKEMLAQKSLSLSMDLKQIEEQIDAYSK